MQSPGLENNACLDNCIYIVYILPSSLTNKVSAAHYLEPNSQSIRTYHLIVVVKACLEPATIFEYSETSSCTASHQVVVDHECTTRSLNDSLQIWVQSFCHHSIPLLAGTFRLCNIFINNKLFLFDRVERRENDIKYTTW